MEQSQSPSSDRILKERLALNKAIERDLNASSIEFVDDDARDDERLYQLWCECSHPVCGVQLNVYESEWTQIRSDPHRFFVAPEHEDARLGEVVERRERFWVVEKTDQVARGIAERTDPVQNPLFADSDEFG